MSTSPLSSSSGVPADAISRRAYELWEKEGRPDGCDMRHWLQAEQELSTSREGSSQTAAASSPTGQAGTTTTSSRPSGNGLPQNGTSTPNTDVRPLQGTRAAAAASRDPKRQSQPGAQSPVEKAATPPATTPPPVTSGRRK